MPVYGAEKLLTRTLDAITAQDDGTIEIICVDDGSPDRCGQILDDYARTHPCVKPIHQENGGITVARDTAMKAARGTWLCFVDDDDIVAENAVAVFHEIVEQSAANGANPDVITSITRNSLEIRPIKAVISSTPSKPSGCSRLPSSKPTVSTASALTRRLSRIKRCRRPGRRSTAEPSLSNTT